MKLLIGIALLVLSIGMTLLSNLLNTEIFFNQVLTVFFLLFSLFLIYMGVRLISSYTDSNRLEKKGLKVNARITEIKRTIFGSESLPDYIIEVSYNHPDDNKTYYTAFEYFGELNNSEFLRKGSEVEILIDPHNPKNIRYSNL